MALALVLAPGLEAATIHKVERASRDVEAAVLLDADTGHTLYALESFRVQAPASTVKLMLLLVVSEAVEMGRVALTDTLVVSKRAADTGASSCTWRAVSDTPCRTSRRRRPFTRPTTRPCASRRGCSAPTRRPFAP